MNVQFINNIEAFYLNEICEPFSVNGTQSLTAHNHKSSPLLIESYASGMSFCFDMLLQLHLSNLKHNKL